MLSPRSTVAVSGRMSTELRHGPAGSGVGAGRGATGVGLTVTFAVLERRWPRPRYEAVTVAFPGVRAVYTPAGEIELSVEAKVTAPGHALPDRSLRAVAVNVRLSPCATFAVAGSIESTHFSSGG